MANPKDVLVLTTSSVSELKIKRYLKPVSAHLVAGTNLFSDFLGSFSDVFGGRSLSYQKQLASLYNEAIDQIKYAAYEIGADCVVGLNIDMDEISGKGKSMFMLTAIGTAVILEKEITELNNLPRIEEKLEHAGVDKINILREKREIIEKANSGTLQLNDKVWSFVTTHHVHEIFPFLLKQFQAAVSGDYGAGDNSLTETFYRRLIDFMHALPEQKRLDLLYGGITDEQSEQLIFKLSDIIKELHLFDFTKCMELFKSDNFRIRKKAVRIATFDKPFYDKTCTICKSYVIT